MLLKENNIHIWSVKLDLLETDSYKKQILSKDEQELASRFRFVQHRARFIATRATLRQLLGFYLDRDPAAITFDYLPQGKPYLKKETFRFNVSHSGNMALIAFSYNSVGIDLEIEGDDKLQVAERFFSETEVEQLKKLSLSERTAGFYSLWTKKEAALKALGTGLTHPLNSFSLDHKAKNQTLHLSEQPITIIDLQIQTGYRAAVASFKQNPTLDYYTFAEKLTW